MVNSVIEVAEIVLNFVYRLALFLALIISLVTNCVSSLGGNMCSMYTTIKKVRICTIPKSYHPSPSFDILCRKHHSPSRSVSPTVTVMDVIILPFFIFVVEPALISVINIVSNVYTFCIGNKNLTPCRISCNIEFIATSSDSPVVKKEEEKRQKEKAPLELIIDIVSTGVAVLGTGVCYTPQERQCPQAPKKTLKKSSNKLFRKRLEMTTRRRRQQEEETILDLYEAPLELIKIVSNDVVVLGTGAPKKKFKKSSSSRPSTTTKKLFPKRLEITTRRQIKPIFIKQKPPVKKSVRFSLEFNQVYCIPRYSHYSKEELNSMIARNLFDCNLEVQKQSADSEKRLQMLIT